MIWDRPGKGEEQEVLRGESDGLSPPTPLQDDSTPDDAEAEKDFWSVTGDFIYRHHVEARVKLSVPREESFPIPLEYITECFFFLETILMITGTRCMDRFHKIYFIERKAI